MLAVLTASICTLQQPDFHVCASIIDGSASITTVQGHSPPHWRVHSDFYAALALQTHYLARSGPPAHLTGSQQGLDMLHHCKAVAHHKLLHEALQDPRAPCWCCALTCCSAVEPSCLRIPHCCKHTAETWRTCSAARTALSFIPSLRYVSVRLSRAWMSVGSALWMDREHPRAASSFPARYRSLPRRRSLQG